VVEGKSADASYTDAYLWRAVDHEGGVLETFVTKRRNRKAALKFLRKAMKRYARPNVIVTDRLRSYPAAMKNIGDAGCQETGRWLNNRAEKSHQPVRRRARDGEIQERKISTKFGFDPRFGPQPF
jgi:transposase-like protein